MDANSNVLLLPLCFFGLYMILEAADWGLCISAPAVSRNQEENKAILNALNPALDGNELWYLLGMFMMGAAIPGISANEGRGEGMMLIGLVLSGALFRMIAVLMKNVVSKPAVMKFMSFFSVIVLAGISLTGTSLLMPDGSYFSLLGIVSALWVILASFQIGTLYGAMKVVNPLGERFRAAFLVSSVLNVIVYIILAILLKNHAGESNIYGNFFWISLVATAILFVVAFFFTRMRHVKTGLVAAYLSSFFAIAVYLSCYAAILPDIFPVEVGSVKQALDTMPSTALLALAVVWSLGSFVWRLIRKKINYEWDDHI